MMNVAVTDYDDADFVRIVTQALNGAIRCHNPVEIYVVRVDNWFDHKWRDFSGVVNLQLGTWCGPLLRVPPFNPNRILSENCLRRADEVGAEFVPVPALPLHIRETSDRNLARRLAQMTGRSVLAWYSATVHRDRASLMVYSIGGEDYSWYASFVKRHHWQVNKVKGISKQAVIELVRPYDPNPGTRLFSPRPSHA